jgi:hypothetical protein
MAAATISIDPVIAFMRVGGILFLRTTMSACTTTSEGARRSRGWGCGQGKSSKLNGCYQRLSRSGLYDSSSFLRRERANKVVDRGC